jgi:uncharacterized protein YdeI (YjbR/CyaY-like superfamily)
MPKKDPGVDAYIENAADFAKPILKHVRRLVHAACPDIEEALKWRCPHFIYKGMVCGVAAFKEHCTLNFWKAPLLAKMHKDFGGGEDAHGQFGRITRLKDLPPDKKLLQYVKEAVALNEEGVKLPAKSKSKTKAKTPLEVPDYFVRALRKNKQALVAFEGFSYSHRKEYIEWITEAKAETTRDRRIAQALEWLAEGKSRNWKYQKR